MHKKLLLLFAVFSLSVSCPALAYIEVSGTISTNTTWQYGDVYVVTGDVTVNSGVQLTIEPGTIVKFDTDKSLIVNGEFSSYGNASSKSYFTSFKDDSIGGDTNGDGTSTTSTKDDWGTIQVNSGASVSMTYSTIRFGGSTPQDTNFDISGGTFSIFNSTIASASDNFDITGGIVSITNNTIKDTTDHGLTAGGSGTLTLNNNTFTDNGDVADTTDGVAYIDFSDGLILTSSGNTSSGTGRKGFVVAGPMDESQTWTAQIPYIIDDSGFTVSSGKILMLDSGAIVKFEGTSSQLSINGRLNASGSLGSPVYFTSYKDDIGGDTNGDSSSTSPTFKDWQSISINSGSTASVSHAVIRYGGMNSGDFYVTGGALDVSDSIVASTSENGFKVTGGKVDIQDSVLNGHDQAIERSSSGTVTVSGSHFYDNSDFAIYSTNTSVIARNNYWGDSSGPYHSSLNSGGAGNILNSNVTDFGPWLTQWPAEGSPITGFINSDQTWSGTTPFVIGEDGLTIKPGKTLTISPGVIVKFASTSSHFDVDGRLDAQGTYSNPIYFTSYKDDTVGGDTNGDGGGSTPLFGDWNSIRINSGSTASMSYSSIKYGGTADDGTYSNVYVGGGYIEINRSTIAESYFYGIGIADGLASVSETWFSNNAYYGIYNNTANTVNAENNYWDSYTGPYHSSTNPSAFGDPVSDYVDYNPWHHITGSGSVQNGQLKWTGSTDYMVDWLDAVDTWNDLGLVNIASDSEEYLFVRDVENWTSVSWTAERNPFFDPDQIRLNKDYMENFDEGDGRLNTILHELGHALGLGHSIINNVMYEFVGDGKSTLLGTQDIYDYNYIWGH